MDPRPTILLPAFLLAVLHFAAPPAGRAQGPRLFYESDGAGTPVVFVEDWATDTSLWFRILPALRSGHELVRYDLRGQGRSEVPEDGDYALAAHREDLARVLDGLGIRSAHLVGAGFGATVALAFALEHPDRTRSVVAIHPHIVWSADAREGWARFLEGYDRSGRPPVSEYASVIVDRWFGSRFPDEEPWLVPFVDLMLSRQDGPALTAALRSWLGTELDPPERRTGVPVLVLWGERSGPPASEPRLHRAFEVRRAPIGRAGGMPHVEAPRETAAAIAAFLESLER